MTLAHGIGGLRDLPVPGWLFIYGAALVLVVSFVALAVAWRRPHLQDADAGRPLPRALQRVLASRALRIALGAVSVGLLVLVAVAALVGDRSPTRNLAPTFVFVVFWLGLVPVVVLLGNVWTVLSPWRATADAVVWLLERGGVPAEPLAAYPARLGRYPAAFLLFCFVAFELAYHDPANPRAVALAVYLYSVVTWFGMVVFGRHAWTENGEAFAVYFGLLARIAPFGARGGELVLRRPLAGLADVDARRGTLAFVAVMLGSVAFDGLSRTTGWQDLRIGLAERGSAELTGTALNVVGLLATVSAVALAYLGAVAVARTLTGDARPLAGAFLASLVPIALVYAVAHYFSLLVLQGQAAVRLASDPLGRGWDLFSTADFRPDLGVLSPNTIWYVQVAALVLGHVAGLALAHDRALALFRSPRDATRSQYALLVLMVAYTVAGLWLLSQE